MLLLVVIILVTATLSNLILVPVLYCWVKEKQLQRKII